MTFLEQILQDHNDDVQSISLFIVNDYITIYKDKLTNEIISKIKGIGSKLFSTNNREDVINLIKEFESIINISDFEESVLMLKSEYRRIKIYCDNASEKIKDKFGIEDKRNIEFKIFVDEILELEPLIRYCDKMNDMTYNIRLLCKLYDFLNDIYKYIKRINQ